MTILYSKNKDAPDNNKHMVQYGLWSNCCNKCDFCLIEDKHFYSKKEQLYWIEFVRQNIRCIDWKNKFTYGISILGGEIFYIKDAQIQQAFLNLVDDIIDLILVPNRGTARFSFVTNGVYEPSFLYKVVDKVNAAVGMEGVDANFSYDLKYRYANENARRLAYNNINAFNERYNYHSGVQMIMTQHVIDLWKKGLFDVNQFMKDNFPYSNLCFLYPHPINTGKELPDFNFKRKDLFAFLKYLKVVNFRVYNDFINSCKNSGTFKYSGLDSKNPSDGVDFQPILSAGKEIVQPSCQHSVLYNCYSDSSRCMLCDLHALDDHL